MSLISIVLSLVSPTSAMLGYGLGRANYAEVLNQLNRIDPDLGRHIHDGEQTKPLTCSDLLNVATRSKGIKIEQGAAYFVRITGLTSTVSAGLHRTFLEDPPLTWSVDKHRFDIVGATSSPREHPWAAQSSYEEIAAKQLLAQSVPSPKVTLELASPTAFRSKNMQVPLPMPNLVFGSLAERWNHFSPIPLNPDFREFGETSLAAGRFDLKSMLVYHKKGAMRIGCIGRITYTALTQDLYWLATTQMLAEFALYGGIGVQTTTGMGQARRLA